MYVVVVSIYLIDFSKNPSAQFANDTLESFSVTLRSSSTIISGLGRGRILRIRKI
jgi:hypothetical protein